MKCQSLFFFFEKNITNLSSGELTKRVVKDNKHGNCDTVQHFGAATKHRTPDREVAGSIPAPSIMTKTTLSTLLSSGFYPGRHA